MAKKQSFTEWITDLMEARGINATDLQRMTEDIGRKITDSTIRLCLDTDRWSVETAAALCEALGLELEPVQIAERFIAAGWKRPRAKRRSARPTMSKVMGALEKTPKMTTDQIIRVFESVQPERPAFMVTVTAAKMPVLLEDKQIHRAVRKAIFGALSNGLLLLYFVPSAEKIRRLREYGQSTPHEADAFVDGFKKLKTEIQRDDAIEAKDCVRLIALDEIHIATPQYLTTLIGDWDGHYSYQRVIERGPVGKDAGAAAVAMIVPEDANYQADIARYVRKVLSDEGMDPFAREFIDRMDLG